MSTTEAELEDVVSEHLKAEIRQAPTINVDLENLFLDMAVKAERTARMLSEDSRAFLRLSTLYQNLAAEHHGAVLVRDVPYEESAPYDWEWELDGE